MPRHNLRILAVIPGDSEGQSFVFARRQMLELKTVGFDVDVFYLSTRTNPIGMIKEIFRFRNRVRNYEPDVVHAHYGTVTGFFAVIFSFRKTVITFRGSDLNPSSEFSSFRSTAARLLSQFSAVFAQEIVCVSDGLASKLWWRRSKVNVIPSGVNLATFHPMPRIEARKRLGWNESDKIILFNHGSAKSPNKRRDLVEQAFLYVRDRIPCVRLFVMEGDIPPEKTYLYFNASDVLVLTSDYEGSPNVIKEGLACNVPICAVEVGDVAKMLSGVDNCILAERSARSIGDGLAVLLTRRLRSNGRNFSKRYSSDSSIYLLSNVLLRASGHVFSQEKKN